MLMAPPLLLERLQQPVHKSDVVQTIPQLNPHGLSDKMTWAAPYQFLLAMHEIKLLMSMDVGQPFWQGASAHLRHRAASRTASASFIVVNLMLSKSWSSSPDVMKK
jgi:hypothetical protein